MRTAGLAALLAGTACLAAPGPPSTIDDGPDGGGGPSIELTGLAARDSLRLNGRDDLVLVGLLDSDPVAFVLLDGDAGPNADSVLPVRLPFAPVDAVVTAWGAVTGIAVFVDGTGAVAGLVGDGGLVELALTRLDEQRALPQRVAALGEGDQQRLVFLDDDAVMLSDVLGAAGDPGDASVTVSVVQSGGPGMTLGAADDADLAAIGLVRSPSRELDIFPVTAGDPPVVGEDLVPSQVVPDGLARPRWRLAGGDMVLVAISSGAANLWATSIALESATATSTTLVDDVFDEIADLDITRLDAGGPDLAVVGWIQEGLELRVYLDPDPVGTLPAPLDLQVPGLEAPVWIQAMDAVGPDGGANEIIVYDHRGQVVCVRVLSELLEECGRLDLAKLEIPALSGSSTSDRPDW